MLNYKKYPWISPAWAIGIVISLVLSFGFFSLFRFFWKDLQVSKTNGLSAIEPRQMDYLWRLNSDHKILDRETILHFTDFYDLFTKIAPFYSVDNYGILAYCYYYLGNTQKSIDLYEFVFQKEPFYFWYPYDLSILYIKTHQYLKAVTLLRYVLQLDPAITLKIVINSRGFAPLVGRPLVGRSLVESNSNNTGIVSACAEHLRQGYAQANVLLNFLTVAMKNHNKKAAIGDFNLDLHVF